jgi:hypothetical protein
LERLAFLDNARFPAWSARTSIAESGTRLAGSPLVQNLQWLTKSPPAPARKGPGPGLGRGAFGDDAGTSSHDRWCGRFILSYEGPERESRRPSVPRPRWHGRRRRAARSGTRPRVRRGSGWRHGGRTSTPPPIAGGAPPPASVAVARAVGPATAGRLSVGVEPPPGEGQDDGDDQSFHVMFLLCVGEGALDQRDACRAPGTGARRGSCSSIRRSPPSCRSG